MERKPPEADEDIDGVPLDAELPDPVLKNPRIVMPYGLDAQHLAKSTMETISDEKIKSFTLGLQKKSPFQLHKEHVEAKKKNEEDEAKRIYQDFVQSFEKQDTPNTKTFVRGETIHSESGNSTSNESKEYKLEANFAMQKKPKVSAPIAANILELSSSDAPSKGRKGNSKKRAIDDLKEEMRKQHVSRDRYTRPFSSEALGDKFIDDSNDSKATTLFLGNLPSHTAETFLWNALGKFGGIQSIDLTNPKPGDKLMAAYAFVDFAERASAEDAKDAMNGKDFFGKEMRIEWGHLRTETSEAAVHQTKITEADKRAKTAAVPQAASNPPVAQNNQQPTRPPPFQITVSPPQNSDVLTLIHGTCTYASKNGLLFEKMLMQREEGNPKFSFLWAGSPDNNYYRWKLYSMMQTGDTEEKWRTTPFQMYVGGPLWIPPAIFKFSHDEYHKKEKPKVGTALVHVRRMPDQQRDTFEDMLRDITTERQKIKEAMGFALDYADYSGEIVQVICEALTIKETPIPTKVARLYLLSDILYNSSAQVAHAASYRSAFEAKLPAIFEHLHEAHKAITGRITAQNLKDSILKLIRIWDGWSLYTDEFIKKLQNAFVGAAAPPQDDDIDGVPI